MAAGALGVEITVFMAFSLFALVRPFKGEHLLDIGMQAQVDRAGMCGTFDHGLLLVGVFSIGHDEGHLDLADAARVGAHGLSDFDFRSDNVHVVHLAVNADDRHGAGREGGHAEVCGGKGFALAIVVHGGIAHQFGPARDMGAFDTQIAKVFCGNCSHVVLLCRQG